MEARGPNPARRPYLLGPLLTPIYTEIHRTMVIFWPQTSIFELSLALCGPQGKIIENPWPIITSLCCMKRAHYSKRMLRKQDWVVSRAYCTTEYFWKQLCWFLRWSAGKKYQDFVQSLVAFPISNITDIACADAYRPIGLSMSNISYFFYTYINTITTCCHSNLMDFFFNFLFYKPSIKSQL